MINGDEKLECMRITLRAMKRDLGKRKDFKPHQQCYVELIVGGLPASGNGGEEPFLIDIRQYKEIIEAEKNRLKAIERARKDLGKKYLWPRWGKPRTRGAGREGCLKEVRLVVYKKRGREDVSTTCLDPRRFREVNVCDNCEPLLDKHHFKQIDWVQYGLQHKKKMKALWDKLRYQGRVQEAGSHNEDGDLDDGLEDSTVEEDFMDVDEYPTDDEDDSNGHKESLDSDGDSEMKDLVSDKEDRSSRPMRNTKRPNREAIGRHHSMLDSPVSGKSRMRMNAEQ